MTVENLFKIKKEIPTSHFSKATIVIEQHRGKNTTTRFLLDNNAITALGIEPGSKIGFILDDYYIASLNLAGIHTYIVVLSDDLITKLNLSNEDYNVINKSKIKLLEYPEENFRYYTFSNRVLYDRLCEEYELDIETASYYSNLVVQEVPEAWEAMLKEFGITRIYMLDGFNVFKKAKGLVYGSYKQLSEAMEKAQKKAKKRPKQEDPLDYFNPTSHKVRIGDLSYGDVISDKPIIEEPEDSGFYTNIPNDDGTTTSF